MKWTPLFYAAAISGVTAAVALAESPKLPALGVIERIDPRFDELIGKDAVLEQLVAGHLWTEGPVWIKDGGYLLFSDIPRNSIYKWQPGKGESLFMKPSGYTGTATNLKEPGSNALLIDPMGRLVLMEHGDRRIARLEKDGKTKTTLVDKFEGKRLNSPNDGIYHSNGDLYFTDPPYGRQVTDAPGFPDCDLDFCGVYRLGRDGKLTLLTKEMTKPNGIAFSPDEKTLYVANSDPEKAYWKAFPVKEDGTLGAGKILYDATNWVPTKKGLPDGMKIDVHGNLFAAGPGGVLVITPEGKLLGLMATGVPTANCGWGEDGTVLYVTADKALCRIATKTKGKGLVIESARTRRTLFSGSFQWPRTKPMIFCQRPARSCCNAAIRSDSQSCVASALGSGGTVDEGDGVVGRASPTEGTTAAAACLSCMA